MHGIPKRAANYEAETGPDMSSAWVQLNWPLQPLSKGWVNAGARVSLRVALSGVSLVRRRGWRSSRGPRVFGSLVLPGS